MDFQYSKSPRIVNMRVFLITMVSLLSAELVYSTSCSHEEPSSAHDFTLDETANVPCNFGGGTVRTIFWYHCIDNKWVTVLKWFKGQTIFGNDFEPDKFGLDNDLSTLIIKRVTVRDEGLYKCDVDRMDDTTILNTVTRTNMFTSKEYVTLTISQCGYSTGDTCTFTFAPNTVGNLTCTLSNVFPTEKVSLQWLPRPGEQVSGAKGNHQNDDGTYNFMSTLTVNVSEETTYSCHAFFVTSHGQEELLKNVTIQLLTTDDPLGVGRNGPKLVFLCLLIPIIFIIISISICFWYIRRRKANESTKKDNTDDPESMRMIPDINENREDPPNIQTDNPRDPPNNPAENPEDPPTNPAVTPMSNRNENPEDPPSNPAVTPMSNRNENREDPPNIQTENPEDPPSNPAVTPMSNRNDPPSNLAVTPTSNHNENPKDPPNNPAENPEHRLISPAEIPEDPLSSPAENLKDPPNHPAENPEVPLSSPADDPEDLPNNSTDNPEDTPNNPTGANGGYDNTLVPTENQKHL